VCRVAENGLHVGKIEIDEAGLRDEIGDPLNALAQNVVGVGKRLLERRALLDHLKDTLVWNRDQRIDLLFEIGDTAFREQHTLAAFKRKRLRDDGDGKRTGFACELRDDRCGARARAAAHTGRDENEIGAVEDHREIFARLFGGFAAGLGIRARAETARLADTDVHGIRRLPIAQRLNVGIDRVEVDIREPGFDHPVDGIAATAADADDFDRGGLFGIVAFRFGHRCLRKK